MTDDLLDFEDDDDLLATDFSEVEQRVLSRYANNHASTSDMFIVQGESRNPNDYIKEVCDLSLSEIDPEEDMISGYTTAEEFDFWLDKYNNPSAPHESFARNGIEPPKSVPNPLYASLAIQRVQWLRVGSRALEVFKGTKRLQGEVLRTADGNVSWAIKHADGTLDLVWFNLTTKAALEHDQGNYRLS